MRDRFARFFVLLCLALPAFAQTAEVRVAKNRESTTCLVQFTPAHTT